MAQNLISQFRDRVEIMARSLPQHSIQGMVEIFSEDIASKRRSSLIKNFEDLVGVLEKRLVVEPGDPNTWYKLNEACERFGGEPFVPSSPPPPNRGPFPSQQTSIISAEVMNYLCTHIKYSWRNFARGLHLSPADIDIIEVNYGSNHFECVREVLTTYSKQMAWSSRSHGNINEDILSALKRLSAEYLTADFVRLTRNH